jgi:hypothetical protein
MTATIGAISKPDGNLHRRSSLVGGGGKPLPSADAFLRGYRS